MSKAMTTKRDLARLALRRGFDPGRLLGAVVA
jgi:hypothetical protein